MDVAKKIGIKKEQVYYKYLYVIEGVLHRFPNCATADGRRLLAFIDDRFICRRLILAYYLGPFSNIYFYQ